MTPTLIKAVKRIAVISALLAPGAAQAQYPNTSSFGVEFSTGDEWYQQCMRAEHVAPPAADIAAPSAAKCSPTDLYYDVGSRQSPTEADWRSVRECAVRSNDGMVLMMLYANGYGVTRNLPLATRYACSLDHVALAEMRARVLHLAKMQAGAKPFDYCDDITSGASGAVCAELAEGRHDRARVRKLDRFAQTLEPRAKPAFARLRAAAAAYASAVEDKESDMHGTAAAGLATQEGTRLNDAFLHDVLDARDGKIPPSSPARYASLDAELNRSYQAVMQKPSADPDQPDRIGESTIARADVRATERAWLAYRDAWVAFLSANGSRGDALSIQALLTRRRAERLARIAAY